MTSKNVTVKIPVLEPLVIKDSESLWSRIQNLISKCPVANFSSGLCFYRDRDSDNHTSFSHVTCEYKDLSEGDMESVRIFWSSSDMNAELDVWDSDRAWPILNTEEVKVYGE
jgi:hypothetical protein